MQKNRNELKFSKSYSVINLKPANGENLEERTGMGF